jgi:hypothetical protein
VGWVCAFLLTHAGYVYAAVMLVLLSFLFSGQNPSASTLQSSGVGFIMDLSYARWTLGALTIAQIRDSPPLYISEAIKKTNSIGFTNVTL